MKIIKPINQSLLYKTYEADRKYYFCTVVLSYFSFDSPSLLSEPDLWKFAGTELGKDVMLDMCMPKPKGEVLVSGRCFAPDGKPVPAYEVNLRIGPIAKTLNIYGDRFWKRAGGMVKVISDPLPFTEMDISYENAYGGPDFKKNPLGKGHAPVKSETGHEAHPLPNIEDPQSLIGSPKDTPEPAGFGPIDLTWPQRMEKAGTYDQKWLDNLFPGLAEDIDYTYFNTAQPDQWISGFFNGDDAFEISGMHPDKKTIRSGLPGTRSRCFMNLKTDQVETFREVGLSLDTVWLFPHAEKGIFIWRGVAEIGTDDGDDVLQMLVAYERLGDEPRSIEHYREALLKRLDEDKGHLYMAVEKDLIPPGEKSGIAALMEDTKKESVLSENMKKRAEKEKQRAEEKKEEAMTKARAAMEKSGLNPDDVMPQPPSAPPVPEMPEIDPANLDPEAIMKFMKEAEVDAMARKEKAMADAMAKKAAAEKKIKDICDKQGLDFEKIMTKLKGQKQKRPVFSADDTIEKLRTTKANVEKNVDEFCKRSGTDYETIVAQAKGQKGGKSFPMLEAVE
jgi:hypothetical protein